MTRGAAGLALLACVMGTVVARAQPRDVPPQVSLSEDCVLRAEELDGLRASLALELRTLGVELVADAAAPRIECTWDGEHLRAVFEGEEREVTLSQTAPALRVRITALLLSSLLVRPTLTEPSNAEVLEPPAPPAEPVPEPDETQVEAHRETRLAQQLEDPRAASASGPRLGVSLLALGLSILGAGAGATLGVILHESGGGTSDEVALSAGLSIPIGLALSQGALLLTEVVGGNDGDAGWSIFGQLVGSGIALGVLAVASVAAPGEDFYLIGVGLSSVLGPLGGFLGYHVADW